jgi:hypothetical protein
LVKTVFIACHLANLDYDLTRLGQMFERNPNLYVDISARFAELAPIPRFVNKFFQKYSDRILYGTDMAYTQKMFSTSHGDEILATDSQNIPTRDWQPRLDEAKVWVREQDAEAARFVHWGATSQDVSDTAMVVLLGRAARILAADHQALASALRRLSESHAQTVMLGRTLLQPAPPVTFGLKTAGLLAAIERSDGPSCLILSRQNLPHCARTQAQLADIRRGGYVLIDRGTDQGVTAGERYAIYRDIRSAGMPLASVGEAVVLSTGKTLALTKITSAHDAVLSGDYVAPRR